MSGTLNVREAAQRLGVSERAVRLRIASGDLAADRRGRDWEISAADVERRARVGPQRGRLLAPAMAWAVLLSASGEDKRAQALLGSPAAVRRLGRWRAAHHLADVAYRLSSRARSTTFDLHDAERSRVLERDDVLVTGQSAAHEVGLADAADSIEVYAPANHRDRIVAEHGLEPGPGPLTVRWVDPDVWDRIHVPGQLVAPRAAILLDLLESDDPRARREAAQALAA